MLSHLVEICKRRDADSVKTSEGVSTLPLSLYSYKKPCAGAQKWETIPVYRLTNTRIYDKVKRLQEETPKRDTQSASPDIIAARRKAGPGRRLENATGNLPNRFGHPENISTSRFLKKDDQSKSNNQRILNVDGNGDSNEMAPLFFETQSFEVVIANEMAEGFARAMGGRIYINILDTAFTDGSGVELARRIRAFAPMPTLVFYLAKALPAEVREAAGSM
jgi:CheY-like chemotaxis protein